MIHFKLAKHTKQPGDLVEIWQDDRFLGAIYPNGDDGIRVISKYLGDDSVKVDARPPTAVNVTFSF